VFFGGAAQFVAGVMEFVCGNTFGCTVSFPPFPFSMT
jgi:succinate-acetate transporter protein